MGRTIGDDARPRVVLSRCLELAACRYDGAGIRSDVVRELAREVDYVPVCPEVEIGLGVPRPPIRIERGPGGSGGGSGGGDRLVQPSTGRDLTERMDGFGHAFADATAEVDGLILKSRSPSCGVGDVKAYAGGELVTQSESGMFARVMRERYPDAAVADEVRLEDPSFRQDWLDRVYASARRRAAAGRGR